MQNLTGSKRIFYFDALRAFAIICVIITHVYAMTSYHLAGLYPNINFDWVFAQILGNPFRLGVILFLMLTGALTLGRQEDIRTFLSKRIPRIAIPFIFWNVILILIYIVFSYWGMVSYVTAFDVNSLFAFAWGALLGKATGFGPNWYFWMILGIYLFMPVLNRWVINSELYEAEYFLVFWLITALFDFTLMMEFPIKLSYFTSPLGFVVLGYYLRHTQRRIFNNRAFVWAMVLVPAIILTVGSFYSSSPTYMAYPHRYSILLSVEAAGIFLLFRNAKFNVNINGIAYKIIFALAKYSYGIYLFHYSVILLIMRNLTIHINHTAFSIILFFLTLAISMAIMDVLSRIPYINALVGAK